MTLRRLKYFNLCGRQSSTTVPKIAGIWYWHVSTLALLPSSSQSDVSATATLKALLFPSSLKRPSFLTTFFMVKTVSPPVLPARLKCHQKTIRQGSTAAPSQPPPTSTHPHTPPPTPTHPHTPPLGAGSHCRIIHRD